MKETKVYVNKMPESCVGCKYFAEHRRQCDLELCLQWSEKKFKFNDCPLIDIKTHDRELVKEVCEKIHNDLKPHYGEEVCAVIIERVLSNLQKEFEK